MDLFSSPPPLAPPTSEGNKLSWLRLLRSRRVGTATFLRLMAEHGNDADAALTALPDIAARAGVRKYSACSIADAHREFAAGHAAGAVPLFRGAPGWPVALSEIDDAPLFLWARGRIDLLSVPAIALVGARNASSLGLRMAKALARGLGETGLVVTSGLARGIDAAAHDAALPTGTIAVVAGGIDVIYPRENTDLTARIADDGLILSEMPPGTQPQARHFPRRNRIISGLSRGVVVVEAAPKSGSLITARDAADQGREVMAVPGHPFDGRAAGCNMLLRDGATLVRNASDVVEACGHPAEPTAEPHATTTAQPNCAPKSGQTRRVSDATGAAGAIPDNSAMATPISCASLAPACDAQDPAPNAEAAVIASTDQSSRPHNASHQERPVEERIRTLLGATPVAEDQLLRDLAIPAAQASPVLLALELDGTIQRKPGGMIALAG